MPKELIFDGETLINATDWKAKSEHIIARLDEELFSKITDDDLYNYRYDRDGCVSSKTKIKLGKGEIKPVISATKVITVLNRLLRIYKPMNNTEAQTLAPEEYIEANLYYLDIISHINDYIVFVPSKQSLSAFFNISVETYNELLMNSRYTEVFKSFEDGFVDTNYMSAQSGMVDTASTLSKLSVKDAGHSLKKAEEYVVYNVTNKINTSSIDAMYEKFLGVSQKPKQIGKSDKK